MFFGLGFGLGIGAGFSPFSAASLFASGGLGLLYNSSDLSTLFQDGAGSTPVTTAGQSVNLTLDLTSGENNSTQPSTSFQSKYQTGPDRKAYDGVDDRDNTTLKPTASGTLAVRMRSNTDTRFAIGSIGSSPNSRCFLGLGSSGELGGGIGNDSISVIKGADDVRGNWVTAILNWDGSTVDLYQDGLSVYSAVQSGVVNTTANFAIGAINNNGTPIVFHDGDIARALVLNRAITTTEVADLSTLWGTIS
jgi:hypothetical protein